MTGKKEGAILTAIDESVIVLFIRLRAIAFSREKNHCGAVPFSLSVEVELNILEWSDCGCEEFLKQPHQYQIGGH